MALALPEATYRTDASPSVNVAALVPTAPVHGTWLTMLFSASPPQVVAFSTTVRSGKPLSVVRVDLSSHEGRVVLRSRCYPAGVPTLIATTVVGTLALHTVTFLVFLALAGSILVAIYRHDARAFVDEVQAQLVRRFASPEE